MESDYKFKYVDEYITNLLDGHVVLQYEDVDLKGEKKPVEYVDKIEKWLEFRNRVREEDPDEFTKLTGELFTHLLAIRLAGVIVDHSCEYCNMSVDDSPASSYSSVSDEPTTPTL